MMTMAFSFKQLRLLICLSYIVCLSQIPLVKCSSTANNAAGSGGGVYGGRHSYSLSTFSPSGDLDQVVRAMRASMLGVPIVALSIPAETASSDIPSSEKVGEIESMSETISSKTIATTKNASSPTTPIPSQGGIYLSIPLRSLATSPFLIDDGTPRIVQVTSSICAAHTGVGADGRALCDIAIRLALDYRYVYGEEISVEELIEGLADVVQEMTMKAGSRPFGCALLVGCLGSMEEEDGRGGNDGPMMYRVDPSGAVVLLNTFNHRDNFDADREEDAKRETIAGDGGRRGSAAFLGNWDPLRQTKDGIKSQLESQPFMHEEELRSTLIDVSRKTYVGELHLSEENFSQSANKISNQPILFASFTREQGLQISRIMNSK